MSDTKEKKHIHHIKPKFICEREGIDPDFEGNTIEVSRFEHAMIHYQRWLEFGEKEDLGAAIILGRGEIDGFDNSGENNGFYGKKHTPETIEYLKKFWKQYYIDNPDKKPIGVKNGMYGKKHSDENKEKYRQRQLRRMEDKSDNLLFRTDENGDRVRKSYKGKNNPRYGAKLTDETKKKISKGNRGKKRSKESIRKSVETRKKNGKIRPPVTEETKRKISVAAKKRFANPENTPMYGKTMSDEAKKNMSKAQKKRFANPENHPMYGKTMKEINPNWVSPLKGKKRSEEDKRKMREGIKKKRLAGNIIPQLFLVL